MRDRCEFETEYRVLRPDGESRWLLVRGKPQFRTNGEFAGYIGSATDITERKRAEAALRESEERFRLAAESASDFIFEADMTTGRLAFFSRPERQPIFAGELPADLAAWERMLHPDDHGRVMQALDVALESGSFFEETYRVVGAGGQTRYLMDRATLLRDAAGSPLRWIGAITDISERKRAEAAQARLAAIVQSSSDAIIGSNLQGVMESWNRGAEDLYGYTEQEALGKHASMLLPPGCANEVQRILEQVRAGGAIRDWETLRRRKDGSLVPVSLTVSPIVDAAGKLVGVSTIARDISERRRAEEMIQRMNDSLRQLSTCLLHSQDDERRRIARDLHDGTAQNLAALSMHLSLLADRAELSKPAREKIAACLALAAACSREVRALSYLLHPPLLDELGLTAALRSYVSCFDERTPLRVSLELPEGFGRLRPELELAVFRIVQEALANVHRHSGSPTAAVRISRHGALLTLQLEDYGCGIRPELLDGREGSSPQLGIGIPGMRERVRQLGGTLRIRSSSEGTLLEISLPLEAS
jgi:PAS domain S-box-containing protein